MNKEIKQARISAGIKAKEMALKLGVSSSYVSQIENGVRPVSEIMLEKISNIVGQKIDLIDQESSLKIEDSKILEVKKFEEISNELSDIKDKLSDIQSLLLKLLSK